MSRGGPRATRPDRTDIPLIPSASDSNGPRPVTAIEVTVKLGSTGRRRWWQDYLSNASRNGIGMSGLESYSEWGSLVSVPDIENLAAELELDLSIVETNNELLRTADLEVAEIVK